MTDNNLTERELEIIAMKYQNSDGIITTKRKENFLMIDNSFLSCPELKPTEKVLYMLLKKYAGADGECFPGHARLAQELGITKRTVVSTMATLHEKKAIQSIRRVDDCNRNTTSLYFITDTDPDTGLLDLGSYFKLKQIKEFLEDKEMDKRIVKVKEQLLNAK